MATSLNDSESTSASKDVPAANQDSSSFGKKSNPAAPFPANSANEEEHLIHKSDTLIGSKL